MSAPTTQRTHLLDALRGFALFGVVFSNYAGISYWLFMSPEEWDTLPGAVFDMPLGVFHVLFIEGKFYSIFSLLFGIGFGFFLAKGNDGLWRFYRRMVVLLIIGWIHLRFFWAGDILFLYAVLGLLLPLFRASSDRALLILAATLILSPIAIDAVRVLTDGAFDPAGPINARMSALDAELGYTTVEAMRAVPQGGLDAFTAATHRTWLFRFQYVVESDRAFKVLGLFLLGLWISRRELFVDPERHRLLLKRVCIAGFAIGLPFSVVHGWGQFFLEQPPKPEGLVATVGYALGVVPMALALASGFTLLWLKARWQQRLSVFAPMGRMALTNYLLQTLIGLLLFTGLGLGWGMRVSSITFEAIAVGVFILQVLWSHWWLARFQFGPMEWVWRSLTYGRVMAMRK